MKTILSRIFAVVVFGTLAFTQQNSTPTAAQGDSQSSSTPSTVRGCLTRSRGNYIVVENKSSLPYVLKGVGDKVSTKVGKEVEVTGDLRPGTIKGGTRSSKAGSNPSDTEHAVDGVPIQIANPDTDVKVIAKKCTAADKQ
jgi:hypothetical protein